MNRPLSLLSLGGALLLGGQAHAGDVLQWQDNSLTYLYGKDFKIDPAIQQTLTFEHASGWSIGDLFLFVDSIHYNGGRNGANDSRTFYGEISPRLSFGKLLDRKLEFGPIEDVLLAATYEFGEDDVDAYLLGPAVDLKVPGFDYFQINTYYRRPDGDRDGRGVWQITPVWGYTLPLGNSDLLIDGYMDWVVDNDDSYHANLHFNPQIKYDLGKAMGWGVKHFYVGLEYDYWKDKYGIDNRSYLGDEILGGTDQNTASLLLKVHF
ncbi:outer membrane protein OmpK [Pseudomonas sp. RIT-PI-AD]|uniref:outer membrane protein OmpK n=1 Tax=Pseudomonas sp. RIT-PI-AD TaxID=3035294 RepID=UPI0021D90DFA|nr:outer membrane protein OmpK [Pseudomonas sp. RIT-PI-AD]